VSAATTNFRLPGWLRPTTSSADLALVLTLVMFVLYAREPAFPFMAVAPLSLAVVIAGLIWPAVRWSRLTWLYLTVAVVWARLPQLTTIDNHQFLIAYWCIAVTACLCVFREDPEPAIASNARWLLGLAMGFAVIAKLRTGEFATGAFFEFLLLSGDRFRFFAEIVGGLPADVLAANRQALASLVTSGVGSEPLNAVTLEGSGWASTLAGLLALWTLLIELVIAVAFLAPERGHSSLLRATRHGSLLLFCLTTYAVATVAAFAWILLILGFAQCREDELLPRFAYGVAFVLVLVYTLPFGEWIAPLLG
jgi:hypothetical protein